jgi:hypothetical protein
MNAYDSLYVHPKLFFYYYIILFCIIFKIVNTEITCFLKLYLDSLKNLRQQ